MKFVLEIERYTHCHIHQVGSDLFRSIVFCITVSKAMGTDCWGHGTYTQLFTRDSRVAIAHLPVPLHVDIVEPKAWLYDVQTDYLLVDSCLPVTNIRFTVGLQVYAYMCTEA